MVVRSIISIALLVIIAVLLVILIRLIIKARKLREERAVLWYLIETEMEEDDDFD